MNTWGLYSRSERKRPAINKTLKELIPRFEGKIVRIGTDGSGYFVCGKLDDELLKDLEHWENIRREQKAAVIAKMEDQLEDAKANLPRYKERLPKVQAEAESAKWTLEKLQDEIAPRAYLRDERRKILNSIIDGYMDKKKVINNELIGNLSPRGKAGAKRSFEAWARKRKVRWNKRLKSYLIYLDKLDELDLERLNKATEAEEKASGALDKLNKSIVAAKGRIEVNPSRIRRARKYLAEYKPIIERNVVDIYKSTLGKDETSIITTGGEMGAFWDCEEFDTWKRTGKIPMDKE